MLAKLSHSWGADYNRVQLMSEDLRVHGVKGYKVSCNESLGTGLGEFMAQV